MALVTREAQLSDSLALCVILNEIIAIGGTTAYEQALSEQQFSANFLTGDHCLCCFLVENAEGIALGFQSLSRHQARPEDCADIATFARQTAKVRGVGTRLFEACLMFARRTNIVWINATIRADNISGLGFYSKMGFIDYSVAKDVALQDGTLVDRISKKYFVREQ